MNTRLLQFFQVHLRGAEVRTARPELGSPETPLAFAILSLVSIALIECSGKEDGVAFLCSYDCPSLVDRYEKIVRGLPPGEQLGTFVTVAVAHTASLLSMHESAEYLVSQVKAHAQGRHFWDEYAQAMYCLVMREPYNPVLGKLVGSQQYWAVYLPFISDVTHGRDVTTALEAMKVAFQKRQTDKRISDDGGTITEGSARQTTRWDFRAEGLKAYATYKYGLTFKL